MTTNKTSDQSEWTDCQGGEISGMARRLKAQRASSRRKQIMQSLSIAAGLLLMVGIGWMMLSGDPSANGSHKGIACSEVIKNGKQYVLHQLDPELAERINAHLGKCENCQRKLTMLRQRLELNPATKPKTESKEQAVLARSATIAATMLP